MQRRYHMMFCFHAAEPIGARFFGHFVVEHRRVARVRDVIGQVGARRGMTSA